MEIAVKLAVEEKQSSLFQEDFCIISQHWDSISVILEEIHNLRYFKISIKGWSTVPRCRSPVVNFVTIYFFPHKALEILL